MKSIGILNHLIFGRLFKSKRKAKIQNIQTDDFLKYFSELQSDINSVTNDEAEDFVSNHDFNDTNTCNLEELDLPISVAEVESVIKNLKRNKAFGNDLLLNKYFISSIDIFFSFLADLFNKILESGHFPRQWSRGIIIPLFKNNDPDDVRN